MSEENIKIERRDFLKQGLTGCGVLLLGSICGPSVCAATSKVTYKCHNGSKRCSKCEKSVKALWKDRKKMKELSALVPAGTKFNFYCRKHAGEKEMPAYSIALGKCNKSLSSKAEWVSGCAPKPDAIFATVKKVAAEAAKKKK